MARRVTIVGGGIAGMTLAAALDPERWEVHVHDPGREAAGTTLAMWPEAMAAFQRLGHAQDIRDRALEWDTIRLTDASGNPIAAAPRVTAYLIDRPDLHDALRAMVPRSVIWHPETISAPDPSDCDVLVGADGVHSVVRTHLFGHRAAARQVGYVALRGIARRTRTDMVEAWHEGVLSGRSPSASGDSNWYLCAKTGSQYADISRWDDDRAHTEALALAEPFGVDAVETVAATAPDRVLRQHIWTVPARWQLVRDNAVLIGDAAHAMCPNLGRGACESIIDAVALGTALNERPVPEALRHYQRSRALPSQGIRAASRGVLAVSAMRRGARVRNRLLRALPAPGVRRG
ncbi:FAD-binding monooxygenase [Epidermidibacterium keratini]|uniref:FAD-binding monooxygenase n=1 Tax=Epidermidibacterium keratini TaxID=1891644 RepID=A0A7L4YT39_9ACTN|nr:FAD-dependent monooxygenase [Epidermidibacterium keratini]QHC01939.1 FAD-binding monooxygenase [Epidermidibacterium keratini]